MLPSGGLPGRTTWALLPKKSPPRWSTSRWLRFTPAALAYYANGDEIDSDVAAADAEVEEIFRRGNNCCEPPRLYIDEDAMEGDVVRGFTDGAFGQAVHQNNTTGSRQLEYSLRSHFSRF